MIHLKFQPETKFFKNICILYVNLEFKNFFNEIYSYKVNIMIKVMNMYNNYINIRKKLKKQKLKNLSNYDEDYI